MNYNEFKTPKKTEKICDNDYPYSLSTAYSFSKSASPQRKLLINHNLPIYNSEFRQYPNIYPNIYIKQKNKFTSNLRAKGLLHENPCFSSDEIMKMEEELRKIIRNEGILENLKEKLAYEPDFIIKNLFDLLSENESFLTKEKIQKFYSVSLNYHISREDGELIAKTLLTYQQLEKIFMPAKTVYKCFYENKKNVLSGCKCVFEDVFIEKTKKLIREIMIFFLESQKEEQIILENNRIVLEKHGFPSNFSAEERRILQKKGILS